MVWSCDERYFFYLAERKPAKTKSFFDQKPSKPDDGVIPGNEYKFVEDWGEQLTGYSKTVLAVFDVEEQNIKLVTFDGGDDKCITKVLCDPQNPNVLYFLLRHINPFRVSMFNMFQRRSDLVRVESCFSPNPKTIPIAEGSDGIAILDVTVSPNGNAIIWLQCPDGGPHNREFEMWKCSTFDLENTKHRIVLTPHTPLFFPYHQVFRPECWLDNKTIVFSSLTKSRSYIRTVDIEKGQIVSVDLSLISHPNATFTLLDVRKGDLLVLEASYTMGPTLILAKNMGNNLFSFKRVHLFNDISKCLTSQIEWQLVPSKYEHYDMEYILAYPKNVTKEGKVPLLVFIHGGPHNVLDTSDHAAGCVLSGFAILLINYPGSLGFESCADLPGKIGVLDVKAIQQATVEALSKFDHILDRDNVSIFGGCHGGFLALRLVAEYPNFYKTCITRNPICDFVQLVSVTDMPDWVFVECGLQPSLTGFINLHDITKPEVLAKFNEQSPTRFADKINCPILMLLGSKDRLVPVSQGLLLYRILKQSKPDLPIKVLMYDDGHSLASIKTHSDAFVNIMMWIEKCRKRI